MWALNTNPRATPLGLVRHAAPISKGEALSCAMKFPFTYEQVRRPLSSLSGWEWTQLQLLLMLSGANCLLLDEPTNHLDIDSVEMLESALESFACTAVVASPDRDLFDRMADRILDIDAGDLHSIDGGSSFLAPVRPRRRPRADAGRDPVTGAFAGSRLALLRKPQVLAGSRSHSGTSAERPRMSGVIPASSAKRSSGRT
jgi:ATPase subunit of ABC transporter with duplicated ATPase domains